MAKQNYMMIWKSVDSILLGLLVTYIHQVIKNKIKKINQMH